MLTYGAFNHFQVVDIYKYIFCFAYHSHIRVRKMKDRYAITEIRKQANRMTFGSVCSNHCYVLYVADIVLIQYVMKALNK